MRNANLISVVVPGAPCGLFTARFIYQSNMWVMNVIANYVTCVASSMILFPSHILSHTNRWFSGSFIPSLWNYGNLIIGSTSAIIECVVHAMCGTTICVLLFRLELPLVLLLVLPLEPLPILLLVLPLVPSLLFWSSGLFWSSVTGSLNNYFFVDVLITHGVVGSTLI